MSHVLHVVDALALGGAERMLVEIANATVATGLRVSVCVTRSVTTLASRLDPRVELLVLGRTRTTELRPLIRMARWIRRTGVEVVHCHGRSSFSLVAALAATHAIAAPIIFHDHRGLGIDASVPRWFPLARRHLAAYVGVYPAALAWAARAGIPAAATHLIPNAVDLAAVERQIVTGPALGASTQPWVICIGGIRREKGIDVLLEAIARVPCSLAIVGADGDRSYAATCRARAARADLAGRVHFLGAREDAIALAATADAAVHSARAESGPLVLAEYAARGVPFVATRVGGVAEVLAAAGAGCFVPPDDEAALAVALTSLLALPPVERASLGHAWRAVSRATFDIGTVVPRWLALYASVRR